MTTTKKTKTKIQPQASHLIRWKRTNLGFVINVSIFTYTCFLSVPLLVRLPAPMKPPYRRLSLMVGVSIKSLTPIPLHPFVGSHPEQLQLTARSCLTLPYLTLPYLTLPYLTLPYLTLLCLTLPYFTLPYLTLPYFALPYVTLPYVTLPYSTYVTLLCLTLPCFTLPYLALPYLTLPYLTLPLTRRFESSLVFSGLL
jgi:hypothetical protein